MSIIVFYKTTSLNKMEYKNKPDHHLLALLKESDHQAYTVLYNRYSSVLYAHALRRLQDREEAKDIIQELFTYLWVNRESIVVQGQVSGYLYTAVRNRVIKVIAHRAVASQYIDFELTKDYKNSTSDYLIRETQLKNLIENEIAALPPKMRKVFLLSRKEHLPHREIANQLNISEFTVKKQVSNALRILRARLDLFSISAFIALFL